jgi:hypothetical protein
MVAHYDWPKKVGGQFGPYQSHGIYHGSFDTVGETKRAFKQLDPQYTAGRVVRYALTAEDKEAGRFKYALMTAPLSGKGLPFQVFWSSADYSLQRNRSHRGKLSSGKRSGVAAVVANRPPRLSFARSFPGID